MRHREYRAVRCVTCVMLLAVAGKARPAHQAQAQGSAAPADGIIQAEDAAACRIEGGSYAYEYPRSVGQKSVWLRSPQSSATVSGYGRAIYLILPPAFLDPGPYYGSVGSFKLRYRIDARPWRQLAAFDAGREVALAEDLPPGKHTLRIEPVEGACALDGFRFAAQPLSQISGRITASDYSELLTDVRADVWRAGKLVRSVYTRNPINGQWSISGLAPGKYVIRLGAAGWQPREIEATLARAGQKVDTGVTAFHIDPSLQGKFWYGPSGFGNTICAAPGEVITAHLSNSENAQEFFLTSPYRKIALQRETASTPQRAGEVRLRVPPGTPFDMYSLGFVYAASKEKYPAQIAQAVMVCEALPENFHIAGVGHTNTWGQEPAEYLAKAAEMAQLAGARTLLVANEVNAPYVAGALRDLRIPYLATNGNHTMPRWDEFFGPRTYAFDDGPQRFVVFNDKPESSWRDASDLLAGRQSAGNRVLVAYEAFLPLDQILQTGVDLLYDGHSDDNHPDRAAFPAGMLHMRALGEQSMRWIAMNHQGLDAAQKTSGDVPNISIPRTGPAPLRAEYLAPNDGTSDTQTARIVNETAVAFNGARIRLVLRADPRGEYSVSIGKILQSFLSDDGKVRVMDIEIAVAGKSTATVAVE